MKIVFCLFILIIGSAAPLKAVPPYFQPPALNIAPEILAASILSNRISLQDKRHPTFQYALNQIIKRNFKIIVETGTARNGNKNCIGDGCSTVIWSDWAKLLGGYVYSVDIDPEALRQSKQACGCGLSNVEFVCSDSVAYLHNFGNQIDFLYLDSYDYDFNNPDPSQQHHLKEIMAAYPYLNEQSVVLIDDCDLPGGGKGKLVIEYLLERGWKIAMSGYQVVMVYKE
ncbi:MAG: class I SAM-dependent methyltransferase [Verrucomicrobia bacterium]|nr:class I SAM-dependent methyltransferase [Verrucomicrobiota bacterium]